MTYEEVRTIAAMAGLIIFITLFVGVLIYTFWPGNSKRFKRASSIPLDKDPDDISSGDKHGQ